MTLTRTGLSFALALALWACGNDGRQVAGPTAYAWPDSFSFLIEFVSESRADSLVVSRYEERKALRFAVREDRYLAWHDSVIKESLAPGREAVVEPLVPEDTLQSYVELGRRGEITHSELACDPEVPGCREALPSALPLELRRLVPMLPVWAPPRGYAWEDTLAFSDAPRPRGARGSVVTAYRVAGDTLVAGGRFWVVAWHSIRRTYTDVGGLAGLLPHPPVEETGLVWIDKERQLPVYATWAGGAVAPPGLRAMGVTSTGYRGRAYLAGSLVEQLLSPE